MTATDDESTSDQTSKPASDLVVSTSAPDDADNADEVDDTAAPERPSVSSYLFAADAGAPRRRRAPDVWRFLVAGALFGLLGWA
ncbi:MAG: hypothetical protein OEV40_28640, partial [Acidimicrobiia bacterium]|nr:hypothetical protein [Acidimicrobiia bacterium]